MGLRDRKRREAFFQGNPWCCFCGGDAPAEEIDHIPARHIFRGRQWPEGYEFPACAACNDASSLDELVLGWLLRIQLGDYDPEDEREMNTALQQLHRRRPEWLAKMRELGRTETRQRLRQRGLSPKDLPGREPYIVEIPEEFRGALNRYAVKLGKALYYLHTGQIVSATGVVKAKVATNEMFLSPKFPWEAYRPLDGAPALTRSGKSLEDQFLYRYGIPVEGGSAGFVVQFRQSTVMSIFVFEDEARYRRIWADMQEPPLLSGAA